MPYPCLGRRSASFSLTGDVAELAREGLEDGFGRAIAKLGHQEVTPLALDRGADGTAIAGALDQIAFPLTRDEAGLDLGGAQVDRGHFPQLATSILPPGTGHPRLVAKAQWAISSLRSSPLGNA